MKYNFKKISSKERAGRFANCFYENKKGKFLCFCEDFKGKADADIKNIKVKSFLRLSKNGIWQKVYNK